MQANGLDERWNQTLQNMLVKFVQSKKSTWSSFLDTCTFAYNTSRHESTHFTPFQLMFNRQATLPIDIELRKALPEEVASSYLNLDEPDTAKVAEQRARLLEEAKQNILQAQQKQKETYDRKHAKPDCYKVGQLVLKKDFTRKKRKGGKLDIRFLGPYAISKVLPHGTFKLMNPSNNHSTIRVTGAHLKLYNPASPSSPPEDEPSPSSSPSRGSRKRRNSAAYRRDKKRRQITTCSSHKDEEPYDVDTHVPQQPPLHYWKKDLGLVDADRHILSHPDRWLNDNLINTGQTMLRKQYGDTVSGLQDVINSRTLSMDIEPGEFIQILNK